MLATAAVRRAPAALQRGTTSSLSSVYGAIHQLHSDAVPTLRPERELPEYWRHFFASADACIAENFHGNLGVYRNAGMYGDPYVADLQRMGYDLFAAAPSPAPFHASMRWVFDQLSEISASSGSAGVLWPAKAFQDSTGEVRFVPLGGDVPSGAEPLNLLTPKVFVNMLSSGYFPIGEPIREHTNQSLCEHDLAHMAAFVASPRFMRATSQACAMVAAAEAEDTTVARALESFDSALSLRLYYTVEVFAEVPVYNRQRLRKLLQHPCDALPTKDNVVAFLLDKARDPAAFNAYLSALYWEVFSLVNPLGGESRDVLNRRRKFARGAGRGSLYDSVSAAASKFSRNSIFSLFMDAKAALEFTRSSHPEWQRAITDIHAPFIGALIGTSQLSIEDWVLQSGHPYPDPDSKLHAYIHDSGFWDESSLLHVAFCSQDIAREHKG